MLHTVPWATSATLLLPNLPCNLFRIRTRTCLTLRPQSPKTVMVTLHEPELGWNGILHSCLRGGPA